MHPEIGKSGIVDIPAPQNAIHKFFPEYTAAHNEEEAKFRRGREIKETPGVGVEFIVF